MGEKGKHGLQRSGRPSCQRGQASGLGERTVPQSGYSGRRPGDCGAAAAEPAEAGGGKRVRRSQQRKQQKKTQRYILIGLCAVVLIAYLVLCGTVCKDGMFPNTKVNGQDLSGMTCRRRRTC